MASIIKWTRVAASTWPNLYPSRILSISIRTTPPDEDGGIDTMR